MIINIIRLESRTITLTRAECPGTWHVDYYSFFPRGILVVQLSC